MLAVGVAALEIGGRRFDADDRHVRAVVGEQSDRLRTDASRQVGRVPDEGLARAEVRARQLARLLDDLTLCGAVAPARVACAPQVVERYDRPACAVAADPEVLARAGQTGQHDDAAARVVVGGIRGVAPGPGEVVEARVGGGERVGPLQAAELGAVLGEELDVEHHRIAIGGDPAERVGAREQILMLGAGPGLERDLDRAPHALLAFGVDQEVRRHVMPHEPADPFAGVGVDACLPQEKARHDRAAAGVSGRGPAPVLPARRRRLADVVQERRDPQLRAARGAGRLPARIGDELVGNHLRVPQDVALRVVERVLLRAGQGGQPGELGRRRSEVGARRARLRCRRPRGVAQRAHRASPLRTTSPLIQCSSLLTWSARTSLPTAWPCSASEKARAQRSTTPSHSGP